jgi:hypothetical protein
MPINQSKGVTMKMRGCKLVRGIKAKWHKTNRHKTRPWYIYSYQFI